MLSTCTSRLGLHDAGMEAVRRGMRLAADAWSNHGNDDEVLAMKALQGVAGL